jgi:hypothetical protein
MAERRFVVTGPGQPFARAGERVVCEAGHHVCDFVEDVRLGQVQALDRQLGNWQQPEPTIGGPIPVCRCGAAFAIGGGIFHFASGWRVEERNQPHLDALIADVVGSGRTRGGHA